MYNEKIKVLILFLTITFGITTVKGQDNSWVEINGVKWATSNVGANTPEDYGGYYTWEEAQSVCPSGWHLPNQSELQSLVNASRAGEWTRKNGVNGRLFGIAPNQVFLPAAGIRSHRDSTFYFVGSGGYYWSNMPLESDYAYNMDFYANYVSTGDAIRSRGLSVRCVKE